MSSPKYIIVSSDYHLGFSKITPGERRGTVVPDRDGKNLKEKIEVFQEKVNAKMLEGYVPIGGMNVIHQCHDPNKMFTVFTQTMLHL